MSRIGKKSIPIPQGVEIQIDGQRVSVAGKRGKLSREFPEGIAVELVDGQVQVRNNRAGRDNSAKWGLSRTLVSNMVVGVSNGFSRTLEILGVGYKAAVAGQDLKLALGYSHEIVYPIPEGIAITVEKNTIVTVSGSDRELIGQTCADIRRMRSPEPYKGKGIRYSGEYVPTKVGKKKK